MIDSNTHLSKIIKITSNISKHEIYDGTFKCPFNWIMSVSTEPGKLQDYLNFYN